MSEAVCEIGVFELGQSVQTLPQYRVDFETAWEWVNIEKIAKWANNRKKNIVMTQQRALGKIRDRSCSPGPKVIVAAAMGKPDAVAIRDGWISHKAA